MFGKPRCLISSLILLGAGSACNQNLTATDIHNERMDAARVNRSKCFTYMMDNAMISDMSIADHHFVAHTNELSGTGVARLDRMVHYLNTYGGTVRYETTLLDQALIEERLDHVREYLASAGCDMERTEATTMISGGRGTPALRAIEVYDSITAPASQSDAAAGGVMLSAGSGSR